MLNDNLFGNFDVTSLILTTFTLFFVGLILYLRREDRREGYPLEDEATGRLESGGGLVFAARPKNFNLPHNGSVLSKPDNLRDSHEVAATRTSRAAGSPLEPRGDPMRAGVGPGAFAERARAPERMVHGEVKIVPMRAAPGYSVDTRDADLRGMSVVGIDGVQGGVVTDVWVDRSEHMIRYLELAVTPPEGSPPAPVRTVLVPMAMSAVNQRAGLVRVHAVTGAQFAGAPAIENPDQITVYEEERVCAYYGAGYLYATPNRAEPAL